MNLYSNRIVVKVGTSTITNEVGKTDLRALDRLVCVLSDVQNMGYEVILVSSGAIAVGANKLNMKSKPSSMRMKQAAGRNENQIRCGCAGNSQRNRRRDNKRQAPGEYLQNNKRRQVRHIFQRK